MFVFEAQQDGTPAHCARNIVQRPQREIIDFLFRELRPPSAQS